MSRPKKPKLVTTQLEIRGEERPLFELYEVPVCIVCEHEICPCCESWCDTILYRPEDDGDDGAVCCEGKCDLGGLEVASLGFLQGPLLFTGDFKLVDALYTVDRWKTSHGLQMTRFFQELAEPLVLDFIRRSQERLDQDAKDLLSSKAGPGRLAALEP